MTHNHTVSIVIFRNASGKTISITVPIRRLWGIAVALVAIVVVLGIGLYLSYSSNIQQVAYTQLQNENRKQARAIKELNSQFERLEDSLLELIEKEEELGLLLGEARVLRKKKLKKKTVISAFSHASSPKQPVRLLCITVPIAGMM